MFKFFSFIILFSSRKKLHFKKAQPLTSEVRIYLIFTTKFLNINHNMLDLELMGIQDPGSTIQQKIRE